MPPLPPMFMPDVERPIDRWLLPDLPVPTRTGAAEYDIVKLSRGDDTGPGPLPASMGGALWHGARGLCPSCGAARLFGAFLKTVPHCPACGQDWSHQRADDYPPYIVILVLGHVIVTGMAATEVAFHPPMWVHLALWIPLILLLGVGLLQPAKGGIIAYQWWYGMGGFEGRDAPRSTQDSL